jgi:MFS family permease
MVTERTLLRISGKGQHNKAPQVYVQLLSCLAGMSNGYNQSVIGGAVTRLDSLDTLSGAERGFITSALCIGGAVGCLSVSPIVYKYGYRTTTIIAETLACILILMQGISINPNMLALFRIGIGFGSAICIVVKPLYVAELSPPSERSTALGLFAWGFSFGLCAAQIIDAVLPEDGYLWRYPLLRGAIFPLLMLLTVTQLPEAEVESQAQVSVTRDCSFLLNFMTATCPLTHTAARAVSILLVSQWTGMALLMTDATGVLSQLGISNVPTQGIFEILFGISHMLGVSVAVFLISQCDVSRKTQLLVSVGCMVLAEFVTAVSLIYDVPGEVAAVGILLTIFAFQVGIAPCFYILGTQIWKGKEAAAGFSLLMAGWFASGFLVTFAGQAFGHGRQNLATFLFLFATIGTGAAVHVHLFCPDAQSPTQQQGLQGEAGGAGESGNIARGHQHDPVSI